MRAPSSAPRLLLLLLCVSRPCARAWRAALTVHPASGPETGGTRVTVRVSPGAGAGLDLGLPWSAASAAAAGVEVRVTSRAAPAGAPGRPCAALRVEEPWRALSCVTPRCVHCGDAELSLWRGGAPAGGAAPAPFAFTSACYAGAAPRLPPRGGGAEACAVCRLAVAAAAAALGDSASHGDVRTALRRACDSPHFKSAGRAGESYCRADLAGACLALYAEAAHRLAEAVWANWEAAYEYGRLPEAACAAIGRCPSPQWRARHSYEDEWTGEEDDAREGAGGPAAAAAALPPPPPPPR